MTRAVSASPITAPSQSKGSAVFTRTIKSSLVEVRGLVADVITFLDRHTRNVCLCQRAEIVLAELLNNIVEHAYGNAETGSIAFHAILSEAGLGITVRDTGRPMPGNSLPDGVRPAADGPVSSLPEGGFGWFLLHSLAQDLRYERQQQTNVTFCMLDISQPDNPE
ncbi:MAG: ATP-binding protein [Dinoroseobacter sp.]|nr:ATP-binding protein [Dinoroseobacter sp.]